MSSTLSKFTHVLVFLMLASVSVLSKTFDVMFVAFSVFCVILFLKNRKLYLGYLANRQFKLTSLAFVTFFAVCCLSLINTTEVSKGISQLEKILRFVFFPFIAVVIAESRIKAQSFFKYTSIALLTSSIAGLASVAIHGPHRIGLGDNALTFGCTFGGLFVTHLFYLYGQLLKKPVAIKNKLTLILSCSALVLAIPVLIYNSSRSVWLGIIAALLMSVFLIPRNRIKYLVALVVVSAACLLTLPKTRNRLKAIVSESQLYFNKARAVGSVDLRFDMWRGALESFKSNPILGTGFGDYRIDMLKHKNSGVVLSQSEVSYRHTAHSNIFHFLMLTGILGLLFFLVSTLLSPLIFITKNSSNIISLYLLGITVYWFGFGLTDTWAAVAPRVDLYILIMAILYGISMQKKST